VRFLLIPKPKLPSSLWLSDQDNISTYQKAVEVADGYGEKVTDPGEVIPALERGLRAVNVEKRQAVINVICSA
jgi:hypothetical protein